MTPDPPGMVAAGATVDTLGAIVEAYPPVDIGIPPEIR